VKVTGNQVFWLILTMEVGMTLVMTLTPGVQSAKQDMWLSVLAAGCLTLFVTYLVTNVTLLHPGQSLIELSRTILGRWIGSVVVVIYLVQWYTIIPIVLRQFADVVNTMIMPETPKWAIMAIMLLLIAYASASNGIVGISRCCEILGPIIVLMIVLVLLSSANNIRLANLLPVYADSGASAILRGALPTASYLGHSVEYLMLASFLYQPRKGPAYAYGATVVSTLVVLVAITLTIATIGTNLTPRLWYPFFEMTRKISLFGFIENLDPLTVVTWVASVFVKLAVYLFITGYGTAQFLGVRRWRALVLMIAPIMLGFALIPKNVIEATANYLTNYWVPFVLPVNMVGLPLLLLIVGKLRLRGSSPQAANRPE